MDIVKMSDPYCDEILEVSQRLEYYKQFQIQSIYHESPKLKLIDADIYRKYIDHNNDPRFKKKPVWILWLLKLDRYKCEKDYFHRLGSNTKRRLRKYFQEVKKPQYEECIEKVTKETISEFYDCYKSGIAKLQNGIDFMKPEIEMIIKNAPKYRIISVKVNNKIVNASLVKLEGTIFRGVYGYIDKSLNEILGSEGSIIQFYLIVKAAIKLGFEYASLGEDISIYGETVSIGVFLTKKRMLFKPIPGKLVYEDEIDVYEFIKNYKKFSLPIINIRYVSEYSQDLVLEVIYKDMTSDEKKNIELNWPENKIIWKCMNEY